MSVSDVTGRPPQELLRDFKGNPPTKRMTDQVQRAV